MLLDCLNQFRPINWFRGIVVASGLDTRLAIPLHRVGSQGNDRPGEAVLADLLRGLVAVHDGHLHVHQDDVERCACLDRGADLLDGDLPVLGHGHVGPGSGENSLDQALVVGAVLGQQDSRVEFGGCPRRGGSGAPVEQRVQTRLRVGVRRHSLECPHRVPDGEPATRSRLGLDLEVAAEDQIIVKNRFSAFIQGSSGIDAVLRARDLDTLLITGTVTNVCCESTARDAAMLNYKVIMVADANAARTDDDHNASLNNLFNVFADVRTTDDVIALLDASAPTLRRTA